jgi:hypothetical protein
MLMTHTPLGVQMTVLITTCQDTIETQIIDQNTGNTVNTRYHDNLPEAIDFAESIQPTRIEFETI